MRILSGLLLSAFSITGFAFNGFYAGAALGGSFTTADIDAQTGSTVDFNPTGGLYTFKTQKVQLLALRI